MRPDAVHGLVGADREVALLLDIIAATSRGPGVEPMAAAVARMITAATASRLAFSTEPGSSITAPPTRAAAKLRTLLPTLHYPHPQPQPHS